MKIFEKPSTAKDIKQIHILSKFRFVKKVKFFHLPVILLLIEISFILQY